MFQNVFETHKTGCYYKR